MSDRAAPAPDVPDARAAHDQHRRPVCGACKGLLVDVDQYRCPYVRCRAWLKTAGEIDEIRARRRTRTERQEDHA